MATRQHAATSKAAKGAVTKKPASRKRAAASEVQASDMPDAPQAQPGGPQALLRAGLQALEKARTDAAKRQASMLEGLLGMGRGGAEAAAARTFPGLDSFGIRKFEEVFDQRVAGALQRLGLPDAQALLALQDELQQLRDEVQALRRDGAAAGKKAAAPRKAATRRR